MVHMYHSFLIHSSADGHIGCFHVLAIINIHCNFWPTNKSSHRALQGCGDVCYKWTSHSCNKGVSFLLVSKGWCYFCSVTKSCPILCNPCTAAHQGPLSSTISWSLLKCMSLSWWCYLKISSPAVPFSFYLQPFPASGSFPVGQLFTSGGQSRGASPLASVLPMNIQGLFPLRLTGLIFLQSRGLHSLLQHHNLKASILWPSGFFMVQLSYLYMTTGNGGEQISNDKLTLTFHFL